MESVKTHAEFELKVARTSARKGCSVPLNFYRCMCGLTESPNKDNSLPHKNCLQACAKEKQSAYFLCPRSRTSEQPVRQALPSQTADRILISEVPWSELLQWDTSRPTRAAEVQRRRLTHCDGWMSDPGQLPHGGCPAGKEVEKWTPPRWGCQFRPRFAGCAYSDGQKVRLPKHAKTTPSGQLHTFYCTGCSRGAGSRKRNLRFRRLEGRAAT